MSSSRLTSARNCNVSGPSPVLPLSFCVADFAMIADPLVASLPVAYMCVGRMPRKMPGGASTGGRVADPENGFIQQREELIEEIVAEARETAAYIGKDALDPRVIAALRSVPREAFVPSGSRALAYLNRPLSIGHGQTISQPFIVALMTDLLGLGPGSRVLEIGTGCGYQTAILAELAAEVHTVEVIAPLAA